MKYLKVLCSVLFISSLSVFCFADETVKVKVNEQETNINGVIYENRTLIPLRGVYEQLGYDVSWNADKKVANFSGNGHTLEISSESGSITVDGNDVYSDVSPMLINDRLYLPLRAVSEGLGLDVKWDGETKTAFINSISENTEGENMVTKLNKMMPTDENYMFSPLSIKMALALAANGATGNTQKEILSAIDVTDIDKYNEEAMAIINAYSPEESPTAENYYEPSHEKTQLSIANSLWLNKDKAGDITFNPEYVMKMNEYFGATLENVNFGNAVEKVNNWCSDKTNNKIPQIIDSSDFLACLINAVYFKAEWVNRFDDYFTAKDTFTDRNGQESSIDFMDQTNDFKYYSKDGIHIVKMPYSGFTSSMYIVLGNDDRADIMPYITSTNDMGYSKVHIKMPKFKTEYSVTLNDMLSMLGIKQAFSPSTAEFGQMLQGGINQFYIDKVLHKTYIDVDESGTEAAAVTAVILETGAAIDAEPEPIIDFIADKPFSYYIVDEGTKEIMFAGEYAFAQ